MTCPTCGSVLIQPHGKRYSLYPAGIVAIIGLAFAALHQVSAPRDFHCESCGLDFSRRTTIARIARAFLWIAAGIFALTLVMAIVALVFARDR